jgi:hypothetical protein
MQSRPSLACSPPSLKSRAMLRLGRDRGISSTCSRKEWRVWRAVQQCSNAPTRRTAPNAHRPSQTDTATPLRSLKLTHVYILCSSSSGTSMLAGLTTLESNAEPLDCVCVYLLYGWFGTTDNRITSAVVWVYDVSHALLRRKCRCKRPHRSTSAGPMYSLAVCCQPPRSGQYGLFGTSSRASALPAAPPVAKAARRRRRRAGTGGAAAGKRNAARPPARPILALFSLASQPRSKCVF